jgi:hypothetical protein
MRVKAGISHAPLRYVLTTMLLQGHLTSDYAVGFVNEINRMNNELKAAMLEPDIDILNEFYPSR